MKKGLSVFIFVGLLFSFKSYGADAALLKKLQISHPSSGSIVTVDLTQDVSTFQEEIDREIQNIFQDWGVSWSEAKCLTNEGCANLLHQRNHLEFLLKQQHVVVSILFGDSIEKPCTYSTTEQNGHAENLLTCSAPNDDQTPFQVPASIDGNGNIVSILVTGAEIIAAHAPVPSPRCDLLPGVADTYQYTWKENGSNGSHQWIFESCGLENGTDIRFKAIPSNLPSDVYTISDDCKSSDHKNVTCTLSPSIVVGVQSIVISAFRNSGGVFTFISKSPELSISCVDHGSLQADGSCGTTPVATCQQDGDCPSGGNDCSGNAMAGHCTAGQCDPIPDHVECRVPLCKQDSDCILGFTCNGNGQCITPDVVVPICKADSDCSVGETCSGGKCIVSPPPAPKGKSGKGGLFCSFDRNQSANTSFENLISYAALGMLLALLAFARVRQRKNNL